MLKRSAQLSLTEQLAERFAERIRNRLLPAGARLPSVRECARQQGVSPYTVVAAYDQLLAQGLVEARPQRGFFVRDAAQKTPVAPVDKAPTALKSIVREAEGTAQQAASGSRFNATALIRGMFHQGSNTPQPGSGVLPMDWLQTSFLPAAVRKVMAEGALQDSLLGYGDPLGTPALRAALSHRLQDDRR